MELLVTIILLGILVVIVAYRYSDSQNRARTFENHKRAQDVTIAVEQFLMFATKDRHYPVKDPSGGFVPEDKLFMETLPDSARDNLSTIQKPDGQNHQRLYYISCKDSITGHDIGVKVGYWNLMEKRMDTVSTGKTDKDADVTCEE